MSFSDDTLMAYADDELAEPARGEVERAVRSDPAIAARVARHRALRDDVCAAFAPIVDEAVPPRLVAAALPGKVADLSAVRAARVGVAHPAMAMVAARAARAAAYHDERRRWTWRNWAGLAAALAMGVLLGNLLADRVGSVAGSPDAGSLSAGSAGAVDGAGGSGAARDRGASTAADSTGDAANAAASTVASAGGAVVAKGPLANALSRQMAGAAGASVDIGISFYAKDGALCRSFVMSETAGLACRSGDQWKLVSLTATAGQHAADQRQVGAMPPAVLDAIDARIGGSPLDAQEEYAARLRGWRR